MPDQFVAAVLGAPFGVKGDIKLRSLSGEVEHLLDLEKVLLRINGTERTMRVLESSLSGDTVLMRFSGFESPESVKALSGAELLVSRDQAAPLYDDEFYVEDLRGLSVVFKGTSIGSVVGMLEGNAADLVEIQLDQGERKLVPFRKEFVGDVDLDKKTLELLVDWILE